VETIRALQQASSICYKNKEESTATIMMSSSSSSSVAILKIHNPPPRIVQAPCRRKECGAVRVCMCELLLGLQKLRCGGASFPVGLD
jgi:hypothetical protein